MSTVRKRKSGKSEVILGSKLPLKILFTANLGFFLCFDKQKLILTKQDMVCW